MKPSAGKQRLKRFWKENKYHFQSGFISLIIGLLAGFICVSIYKLLPQKPSQKSAQYSPYQSASSVNHNSSISLPSRNFSLLPHQANFPLMFGPQPLRTVGIVSTLPSSQLSITVALPCRSVGFTESAGLYAVRHSCQFLFKTNISNHDVFWIIDFKHAAYGQVTKRYLRPHDCEKIWPDLVSHKYL